MTSRINSRTLTAGTTRIRYYNRVLHFGGISRTNEREKKKPTDIWMSFSTAKLCKVVCRTFCLRLINIKPQPKRHTKNPIFVHYTTVDFVLPSICAAVCCHQHTATANAEAATAFDLLRHVRVKHISGVFCHPHTKPSLQRATSVMKIVCANAIKIEHSNCKRVYANCCAYTRVYGVGRW